MDEHLLIVIHRARADTRAIDFSLTWTPTDKPITLWGARGKSYGGFTVRFNTRPAEKDRIPANKVVITVPEGVTKGDLAVKRLPWADFTAPFPGGEGPSGLAIFVHPSHPDTATNPTSRPSRKPTTVTSRRRAEGKRGCRRVRAYLETRQARTLRGKGQRIRREVVGDGAVEFVR